MIVVALLAVEMATRADGLAGRKLIWSDEFNQTNGSSPDPAKWVFDLGGDGWGNREVETYTARPENCRVENGMLVIEARAETFSGKDGIARNFTSARIKTKTKAAWTYGRMEARIKVPAGQGVWPAFWMLGDDIGSVGWPSCGEIDIMECIGREPAATYGTIHGPEYSGGKSIGGTNLLTQGKVADDFHVFAIEWTSNSITWFLDDQKYFAVSPQSLPPKARWVFDKPHFLLLNFAVGGNWPGNPKSAEGFPKQMLVDYVRVYTPVSAN